MTKADIIKNIGYSNVDYVLVLNSLKGTISNVNILIIFPESFWA